MGLGLGAVACLLSCLGVVYGVVHCLVIFSGDRADEQPKNESMDGQRAVDGGSRVKEKRTEGRNVIVQHLR